MNITKRSFFSVTIIALFSACNQNAEKVNTAQVDTLLSVPSIELVLTDTSANDAFKCYENLKDVLVKSNAAEAQKAAAELSLALSKVKGNENAVILANKIAASTDLSDQRKNFTALSNDAINIFKPSEISAGSIYVQYCPMANEGEGAYWLSSKEEIMNPYYGDEMLHCGEVKETIAKK